MDRSPAPTLYLVAPFNSLAEYRFNEDLARALRTKGYEVVLPQAIRNASVEQGAAPAASAEVAMLSERMCKALDEAAVVVHLLDVSDALEKSVYLRRSIEQPIIGVRTAFHIGTNADIAGLARHADRFIFYVLPDLSGLAERIVDELRVLLPGYVPTGRLS